MKLSKKKEKELMQVYEAYWAEYLNGNVDAMQSLLDDSYTQVGSAESEVFASKKEAVQFLVDTINQVAGKLEMRNRSTKLEQQDHLILIHELCDLYAFADKKWIFYSKFRASTLLQEKKEGWKITHQHSSFPDTKTEAGQNVAIEKIAEENKELREAVKRRTVELEHKNRELQIEAALERVRARTMAMQNTDDIAATVTTFFNEIIGLGLGESTRCGIGILSEAEIMNLWTASIQKQQKITVQSGSMDMNLHPMLQGVQQAWSEGKSDYEYTIEGDDIPTYFRIINEAPNYPVRVDLDALPETVYHYSFVFREGILFVFAETPLSEEIRDIFTRFASVFGQTYTRFLDLRKAEAQTREARIEAALERVRARAMAMHKSEELAEAAELLYLQLKDLGIDPWTCGYVFVEEEKNEVKVWMVNPGGKYSWGFWTVPMSEEKVLKERHESWKRKENIHRKLLKGQENIDHHRYIVEHSPTTPDEAKDFFSMLPVDLLFTSLHFSHGYLMVISESFLTKEEESVLLRFTQVFELTYTRFLDLQKAEAQTRKAQIEASLERLRARIMAMHRSEELIEVLAVLYDQLATLDMNQVTSFLSLYDIESRSAELRFTGILGYSDEDQKTILDLDDPIWAKNVAAWEKRHEVPYYCDFWPVEEVDQVLEIVIGDMKFPAGAKPQPEHYPSGLHTCVALSEFGDFGITLQNKADDETIDIMMRFGKVFDQAYTRFSDLQKAEAQAREAQIEAALERVRARSMAMHKSEELKEVIQVVYDQFVNLNIHTEHTGFIIDYKENDDMHIWLADKNEVATEVIIPYFDCAHWNSFNDAKKNGKNFFANHLTFEEKNKFYKDLFKQTPDLPKSLLEIYLNYPGLAISTVLLENVGLYIENFDGLPYSDEENDTLMRFGKVFQQTYTRFLDLQKAEAQAREAQIETALEKIRNRTLLMRDSGELNEAVAVFFQQFQTLQLLPAEARTYFCHIDANNDVAEVWMTHSDGTVMTGSHQTPLTKSPSMAQYYKSWKQKQPIIERNYTGKALTEYLAFVSSLPHVKEDKDYRKLFRKPPDRIVMTDANFLQGNIGIMTFQPIGQEAKDMLVRFASVFEFTYTRFLDLQKAEAQARESQIEAGLEKVRSRSLAMHNSEELKEAATELYNQILNLGFEKVDSAGFIFPLPEENIQKCWFFETDTFLFSVFEIPYQGDLVLQERIEASNKGMPYLEQILTGKKLQNHMGIVMPESLRSLALEGAIEAMPSLTIFNMAFFKNGYINLISHDKLSKAEQSILIRFAKVFEQTYTRFLDLQKAEAQAREALIEVALERVRGRAMAMHKSHELLEAGSLLYQELLKLGISSLSSGYNIMDADEKIGWNYMSNQLDGTVLPKPMGVPHQETEVMRSITQSWKNQEPFHLIQLDEEATKAHQTFIAERTINFNLSAEELLAVTPKHLALQTFNFRQGYLLIVGAEPLSEVQLDMMLRFTKAFQQSYTRFLDLQKAEAQTRESQIEAAMERIRSRAIAMRTSDELLEVALEIRIQTDLLGQQDLELSVVHLYEKDAEYFESLAAMRTPGSEGEITTHKMKFPVDATPEIQQMMKNYWAGLSQYTIELNLKQREAWQKVLETTVPDLFDQRLQFDEDEIATNQKEYWNFADFSGGSLLTVTYSPPSQETKELFKRSADVFDLAYRRYKDLKKAEAQAREAQIEVALERVRGRTMAMHYSNELREVVGEFFRQAQQLGFEIEMFVIFIFKPNGGLEWWGTEFGEEGLPQSYDIPPLEEFKSYPRGRNLLDLRKGKKPYEVFELVGEECKIWTKILLEKTGLKQLPTRIKRRMKSVEKIVLSDAVCKYGIIEVAGPVALSDENAEILQRFAKVFEQTYTRFLDVQKAEAQAREAKVEASLERVRSRTMAMHKSEELLDAAEILSAELVNLEIPHFMSGFVLVNETAEKQGVHMGVPGQGRQAKFYLPLKGDAVLKKRYTSWKNAEPIFYQRVEGEKLAAHMAYVTQHFGSDEMVETGRKIPDPVIFYCGNFKEGYLHILSEVYLNEEQESILARFTKIFQQTYTRFLDLQKAEAQAREAQIENALEKVRSRSLAMRQSPELLDVITEICLQLGVLDITLDSCFINIYKDENPKDITLYITAGGRTYKEAVFIPFINNPIFTKLLKARENKDNFFSLLMDKKQAIAWWKQFFAHATNIEVPRKRKNYIAKSPGMATSVSLGKYASIHMARYAPIPYLDEENQILMRFGKVFDQVYTRFLDLQKAEAQTREAQIEGALERVRSKTMAMHNSKDLEDIVVSLFDEVLNLGIDKSIRCGIGILEGHEGMETRSVNSNSDGTVELRVGMLNMTIHPMLVGLKKAWKNGSKGYTYEYTGKDVRKYYEALNNEPEYPFNANLKTLPEREFHRSFFFSSGILFAFSEAPISEESSRILARFAAVFGQTYRRFLDLQKAEAQAREAEIETALEKVRSRTMAMHKSEELAETALVLYEQFSVLGNIPDRMSIGIFKEETKEIELWPTDQSGSQLNQKFTGSWEKSANMTKMYEAWKADNDSFVVDLSGQKLKTWLKFIREEMKLFVDDSHMKGRRAQQAAFFSHGMLLFTTNEPVAEEIMQLLIRFAQVFSQTYTRFLDLQKAEAQTREARIENTLEKVRSRTMAMQHSYELPEAANNLFLQVQALGIPAWSAGYCIWETEDKKAASCNMSSEGEIQKSFILPTIGEGYNFYDPLQKGETFYVEELGGEALVKHYDFMRTLPTVGQILDELIAAGISLPTFQIFHIVYFPQGYLMFITYEQVPDAHEIFKRFAKVFEQTYTRFLDLKKAEAQAREATKQASLDRVRGQIASMRTANDLERITPLVWNELTTMSVPFIRCGVFIIDEPTEIVQVYLSAPDGHSLGVLHLQFNADPLTANTVAHWRKGRIFKEHWNREEFISWTQSLMEQGQISDKNTYQGAANPPESLNLHFIPFTQGMLYVGSENPLNVEQIELVQSLAEAFAIAYARYEDFTKLEKAKQSVEITLSELKTTQNQLVQSEKMASLGELTAGIAHEIQNPLNFVNNFSEVSKELLEEMMEEMQKGDVEEVKALAEDIIQNLEKINHHGKRADGIVKGMLQHSRTSSGEKELTDINVLADKYLRLAYHGLRAKDKTFNAAMKTDFGENIGDINIIPQDIGRVMLNLITNAFYAVDEKKKQLQEGYEPKISVSTKKINGKVEIKVTDNGNGIPKKVLAKIFQPFFTTKPTGQGTGLGLSLSYDIIKAHKGEISVQSKVGEGTTFTIALPA